MDWSRNLKVADPLPVVFGDLPRFPPTLPVVNLPHIESLEVRRNEGRNKPDGHITFAKIRHRLQFGKGNYEFGRDIVRGDYSNQPFAVTRRDFGDGESLGDGQRFKPFKIGFVIGVWQHNDFMPAHGGDELLRAGRLFQMVGFQIRPNQGKGPNLPVTAKLNRKSIGTIIGITKKSDAAQFSG